MVYCFSNIYNLQAYWPKIDFKLEDGNKAVDRILKEKSYYVAWIEDFANTTSSKDFLLMDACKTFHSVQIIENGISKVHQSMFLAKDSIYPRIFNSP